MDVEPIYMHFVPAIFVEREVSLSEDSQSAVLFVYGTQQVLKQVTVCFACLVLFCISFSRYTRF